MRKRRQSTRRNAVQRLGAKHELELKRLAAHLHDYYSRLRKDYEHVVLKNDALRNQIEEVKNWKRRQVIAWMTSRGETFPGRRKRTGERKRHQRKFVRTGKRPQIRQR
jgi:hypothetical protein